MKNLFLHVVLFTLIKCKTKEKVHWEKQRVLSELNRRQILKILLSHIIW